MAVVPPAIQVVYLALILQVEPKCLALADVAVLAYPSLLMGLLGNEAGRALQGWGQEEALFTTLRSDDLLLMLRPPAALFAAAAAALCAVRAGGVGSSWPSRTMDCSVTALYWIWMAVLFFFGATAAVLLGPMSNKLDDG